MRNLQDASNEFVLGFLQKILKNFHKKLLEIPKKKLLKDFQEVLQMEILMKSKKELLEDLERNS